MTPSLPNSSSPRTTHSAGTPLPPHPLPPSAPTVGPYTFRSPCVLCSPGIQPQDSDYCLKDLYSQDRLKVPDWVDHRLHQPVTALLFSKLCMASTLSLYYRTTLVPRCHFPLGGLEGVWGRDYYRTGPDKSHPLHRTQFGQYLASSAVLG